MRRSSRRSSPPFVLVAPKNTARTIPNKFPWRDLMLGSAGSMPRVANTSEEGRTPRRRGRPPQGRGRPPQGGRRLPQGRRGPSPATFFHQKCVSEFGQNRVWPCIANGVLRIVRDHPNCPPTLRTRVFPWKYTPFGREHHFDRFLTHGTFRILTALIIAFRAKRRHGFGPNLGTHFGQKRDLENDQNLCKKRVGFGPNLGSRFWSKT